MGSGAPALLPLMVGRRSGPPWGNRCRHRLWSGVGGSAEAWSGLTLLHPLELGASGQVRLSAPCTDWDCQLGTFLMQRLVSSQSPTPWPRSLVGEGSQ